MAKSQIKIYISDGDLAWLDKFPPADTKSGCVNFAADWAVAQFKRGAASAIQLFDQDERVAIVASLNGFVPDAGIGSNSLALRTRDWFAEDSGMMLGWSEDNIKDLVDKIAALSPAQTMGLICWGMGFWRDEPGDIGAYAGDLRGLF